ncbi:MAG: hypothetical protein WBQ17_08165, partial [Rhizomicrobium sp.]
MTVKISSVPLSNLADWDSLKKELAPKANSGPHAGLITQLSEARAVSAIIEHEYLDQDFTEEFSKFYSKLFRRHTKVCRRFHFFSADVAPILKLQDPQKLSEELQNTASDHYLGFIVVRPVIHAPIGRTVISAPKSPAGMASKLLVRATYEVHLLGASFKVEGVPMIQQDTRVGACAQASIWIAGRHFHAKHRGPWFSVAQITEEALKPVDTMLSLSLPAGSAFLGPDNMVRALRAMAREPIPYIRQDLFGRGKTGWALDPSAAICRYIDSGIPVILGLAPLDPKTSDVGHAVIAVGQTSRTLPADHKLPKNATRSEFCEAFLVNDDQRGPYLRLPVSPTSTVSQSPYNIATHLQYLLVPLPNKVYLPAETAEKISWDLLRYYVQEIPKLKTDSTFDLGASATLSDDFVIAIADEKAIARTYLTYGWKYKQRVVRNTCS